MSRNSWRHRLLTEKNLESSPQHRLMHEASVFCLPCVPIYWGSAWTIACANALMLAAELEGAGVQHPPYQPGHCTHPADSSPPWISTIDLKILKVGLWSTTFGSIFGNKDYWIIFGMGSEVKGFWTIPISHWLFAIKFLMGSWASHGFPAQWSRKGSRRPPGSFDNQFNTHGPLHSRLGLYQWRPVHKSLLGKWQLRGHACTIIEILSHSLSDEIIRKLLFPSLEINYQGTWEPKRSRKFFFMNTLW